MPTLSPPPAASTTLPRPADAAWSQMLNKVPAATLAFWVIKMMSTTVGETAADFLIFNVGLGLVRTSLIMSGLLVAVLAAQFWTRRYIPSAYWLAVVMVSIVGTLVSDTLVDAFGIELTTTTILFAAGLSAVFALWFASERTLSIHTIVTRRREAFYWTAILFTFALGTSAGDLVAESFELGYAVSAALFGLAIAIVFLAYGFGLNAVLAFWTAYILTRPLGASMGDLMSQPAIGGGLGLGTTGTSVLFLAVIAALVGYLTWQERQGAAAVRS